MRICSKCGCPTNPKDLFCAHCGASLPQNSIDEELNQDTQEKNPKETIRVKSSKREKTFFLLSLFSCIFFFFPLDFILIVLSFCFYPKKEDMISSPKKTKAAKILVVISIILYVLFILICFGLLIAQIISKINIHPTIGDSM